MTDLELMATRVAKRLIERGETVAVVESAAAGLISAALLTVPGASRYFLGGAVVYTGAAREALLGITGQQMAGLRSTTEPYALLLARTIRAKLGATWGLSETGAAGPAGNRYGDPPGTDCIAVSGPVEQATTLNTGVADRAANMQAFAIGALAALERALGA